MTQTTLALSIAGTMLTAFLYLYVGETLRRRPVSSDARLAHGMFVLWWDAIGGIGLLGGIVLLGYMAGVLNVWLYKTYTIIVLLGLFAALWGLQFYLVYLYTGSRKSFPLLGAFYTLLFTALLALVEWNWSKPFVISDDGWQIVTLPKIELNPWAGLVFALVLLGPQVFAAVSYARLYRKTNDPTQKYRIALVTGTIIIWFGSSILGSAAQVSTTLQWQLFSRLVSILGALVILMAYKPPRWVREKYGIRSIKDERQGAPT
jgi:hypothetical protein